MNVTMEKPQILTLLYRQEKGDPDYGSCLWARFYLDLKNYTMSIESDCGNYFHSWVPTPRSESFLHLLARMGKEYLLYKISSESVVNADATWKAAEEMVAEAASSNGEELQSFTWDEIKEACYRLNDDREIIDAVEKALLPTSVWYALDFEQKYSFIVHDYPANAKKIVSVFDSCIRPRIREVMGTGVPTDRWISVMEGLPQDENQRVLVSVYTDALGPSNVDTDRYSKGKWIRWGSMVTHWKPILEEKP